MLALVFFPIEMVRDHKDNVRLFLVREDHIDLVSLDYGHFWPLNASSALFERPREGFRVRRQCSPRQAREFADFGGMSRRDRSYRPSSNRQGACFFAIILNTLSDISSR